MPQKNVQPKNTPAKTAPKPSFLDRIPKIKFEDALMTGASLVMLSIIIALACSRKEDNGVKIDANAKTVQIASGVQKDNLLRELGIVSSNGDSATAGNKGKDEAGGNPKPKITKKKPAGGDGKQDYPLRAPAYGRLVGNVDIWGRTVLEIYEKGILHVASGKFIKAADDGMKIEGYTKGIEWVLPDSGGCVPVVSFIFALEDRRTAICEVTLGREGELTGVAFPDSAAKK